MMVLNEELAQLTDSTIKAAGNFAKQGWQCTTESY
jgi:hypothetical protein